MRVCVLGAGIVGLASSYALSCAGHDVTVIDRAQPGGGASGGNGAQLSYAYVQPLADAGIWAQLPQLLLSPISPLKIRPQWDVHQWLWGLRFLAACNAGTSRATTVQLLQLAAESALAFEQLMAVEQIDCDFSASGKLVLYADARALAAARRQMQFQRELGSMQEVVDANRCVDIEPALAHRQASIDGAIYTPGECAADCLKTCEGLVTVLRARGVKFLLDTPIEQLVRRGKVMAAVKTPQGLVEADQFVMALGAASAPMARSLGVHLPVYPLKGYSITVAVDDPARAPTVSVTDSARKVVFARLGSRLRVAGMAELTGYGRSIDAAQIASLKAATQSLFPGCSRLADLHPWAGLRPATPTARPFIGRHAKGPDNLLFNVGHGALGFTLAFGSAGRIAALLNP